MIYLALSLTMPSHIWKLKSPPTVTTACQVNPVPIASSPTIAQANMHRPTHTITGSAAHYSSSTPSPTTAKKLAAPASPGTPLPPRCASGHSTHKQFACANHLGVTTSHCPCLMSGVQCTSLCTCRNCQNTQAPDAVTTTPIQHILVKCRCGEGNLHLATCSLQAGQRKGRCPCLKSGNACTPACKWQHCSNPHGTGQQQAPRPTHAEAPWKRFPLGAAWHSTMKRKAVVFMADEHLLQCAGPHTSLEYF